MEKRKLNKLGIETSLLGFGCMRFPTTAEGKIDREQAEKMLSAAMNDSTDVAEKVNEGVEESFEDFEVMF